MTALSPVNPGEMLREEFLKPLNRTAYRLAKDESLPARERILSIKS